MAITPRYYLSLVFKTLTIFALTAVAACQTTVTSPSETAIVQRVFSPTWDANSERLAFLYKYRNENSQEVKELIYTSLPDGQGLTPIVELQPARFNRIYWSANNQNFALTTEDSEEIYLVSSTGFNLKKIGDGTLPAWDKTGTKLVYVHDNTCEFPDRVGGRQCSREIRLYEVASEATTSLPHTLAKEVIAPAWSVDGTKIQWLSIDTVQSKELSQRVLQFNTFVLAAKQHVATTLDPVELSITESHWSKDRNLLVFNYLNKVNLFDFNDKKKLEVTNGIEPQISSDNSRILFTRMKEKERSDIMLLNRQTNTEQVLINHQSLPLN